MPPLHHDWQADEWENPNVLNSKRTSIIPILYAWKTQHCRQDIRYSKKICVRAVKLRPFQSVPTRRTDGVKQSFSLLFDAMSPKANRNVSKRTLGSFHDTPSCDAICTTTANCRPIIWEISDCYHLLFGRLKLRLDWDLTTCWLSGVAHTRYKSCLR